MRLETLRARPAHIAAGALLSTTILAAGAPAAQSETPQTTQTAPTAQAASGPVATKASSSLALRSVRRHVIAGRRVVVAGVLNPRGPGRLVKLRVRAAHGWRTVDRDRTGARGRFRLAWRTTRPGSVPVRVAFTGSTDLTSANRRVGRVNAYRRAFASWYGPGLYGNHLACGGRLTSGTLGVAHKWLPCGTRVTLHYRGRTVRVPVIDRGPYVGGRDFDLTYATKARLGFPSTGVVLSTR